MSVIDITPPIIDTTPPIMDITGSPCFLEKQRVIQALTNRRDEMIEGVMGPARKFDAEVYDLYNQAPPWGTDAHEHYLQGVVIPAKRRRDHYYEHHVFATVDYCRKSIDRWIIEVAQAPCPRAREMARQIEQQGETAFVDGLIGHAAQPASQPAPQTTGPAPSEKRGATTGILFAFDRSGSMNWGLDGNEQAPPGDRRIDFARAAFAHQIDRIPDQVPMGLILFPHTAPCDTTVAVPIDSGHKTRIAHVISQMTLDTVAAMQGYGGTPLTEAIHQAGRVAQQYGRGVKVVVLTDGVETCEGDPVRAARWWRGRGIDIEINTVGFVVNQVARQQLSQIAQAGGGQYYDAQDSAQLSAAIESAVDWQPTSAARRVPHPARQQPQPAPAPQPTPRSGGFRSAVDTTIGFTRVMFATTLMLTVGAGMLLGGMSVGEWLARGVLPGLLPRSVARPFAVLTPALSLMLFVLYMMPFIWDRVGNSSRFRWTTQISRHIGTLGNYTRVVVAGALILATGYAMVWGGMQAGEWLSRNVLHARVPHTIASLATVLVPVIGFVLLVLYVAPWLWDRVTGRGVPSWTHRARGLTGKLLRTLLIALLILAAVAIVLWMIR